MSENQVEFLASPVKGRIRKPKQYEAEAACRHIMWGLVDWLEINNKPDRQIYRRQE